LLAALLLLLFDDELLLAFGGLQERATRQVAHLRIRHLVLFLALIFG